MAATAAVSLPPLLPSPAQGQRCPVDWDQPVACAVELEIARPGQRRAEGLRRAEISIPAGTQVELIATARDQRGRIFPPRRMSWGIEAGRECRGRVSVEEVRGDRFRLSAGTQRGVCELLLWVPGNLNLDQVLRVEVVSRFHDGFDRREAELVARSLFRAILGREADAEGLRAAVAEVQRGRLESQVQGMCASSEYRAQRQRLPATQLLEEFYLGILGRPPDSAGVRNYLRDVERGRCAEVVLSLVRSEEHEARILAGS